MIGLLLREQLQLNSKWASKRPEELRPEEFIDITAELYGEVPAAERFPAYKPLLTRDDYATKRVWRYPSKNIHPENEDVVLSDNALVDESGSSSSSHSLSHSQSNSKMKIYETVPIIESS